MNTMEPVNRYSDFPPTLTRRISYDYPEKSPKKEKKWSFGRLFRIKKRNESDSSSGDESKKKKKKVHKKKKNTKVGTFDHVVIRPNGTLNGYKNHHEESLGILSEPSFPSSSLLAVRRDPTIRHISPDPPRRDRVKARAEARRDRSMCESSDEDSQRSASSRFRSDESLSKYKEGSLSRRSRAARTERYLKRLSHCEEFRENARISKSDIEPTLGIPPSKSPTTSTFSRFKVEPTKSIAVTHNAISSHQYNPKYQTINLGGYNQFLSYQNAECNDRSAVLDQRSLSCDADIHASPSPTNAEILHAQFSLGKPFTSKQRQQLVINQQNEGIKQPPPPPPPRDPRRIVSVQNYENRPISYSFESGYSHRPNSNGVEKFVTESSNFNPKCRSTSEDHISTEPLQRIPLVPRPSSATPETNRLQRIHGRKFDQDPSNFRYLTEKQPRSRKPITIQNCVENPISLQKSRSQKTFDFWRQKEEEMARCQSVKNTRKSTPNSPTVFTAQTHVKTVIFPTYQRESSPFRPITPDSALKSTSLVVDASKLRSPSNSDENGVGNEKPKNLEDALDELEAIYNSLHLGDEDLLDRAEKREAAAVQKRKDALVESFPSSMVRSVDEARIKRYLKRSDPDRRGDDMAFRKLNKERSKTISDPQAISKVSYLLSSPLYTNPDETIMRGKRNNEPDITFDDVVYRNIKHTVNSLKIADPQPPFGIPLGPITPAANSDYLHAAPEPFEIKSSRIPDVVKDDLAYRNLRKDDNKIPALPLSQFSSDDYINNNRAMEIKCNFIPKKKRAVRSMSANLFNTMQKEWEEDQLDTKENIAHVADALEIARQILKEKEEKIKETRKAFMSDGETKYRRYGSKLNDNVCKLQVNSKIENTDPALDKLLTDLAIEARETSEKITNELKVLGEEKRKSQEEKLTFDINKTLDEIDTVGEELCKKIYETSRSNETKDRETIPDVGETKKTLEEIVGENQLPQVEIEKAEPDHDYENIHSHSDSEKDEEEIVQLLSVNDDSISVDLSPLEKNRDEIIASFQRMNEMDQKSKEQQDEMRVKKDENGEGEACVNVNCAKLPNAECASCLNLVKVDDEFSDGELDSLKSPKLVQRVELATRDQNERGNSDSMNDSACSGTLRHTLNSKELSWWHEPYAIVPFAYVGALACTEFACLDFLTLLGLVFVILLICIAFILHR